jgi:putative ABC transport system permease protein
MSGFARILRRQMASPLFALTVALLVAAVVAVNASAFGAIHALRWKALPYAHGDELVDLRAGLVKFGFEVGLTERLRGKVLADDAHFAGALGFKAVRGGSEDGRTWQLARVTPEFSAVLGVDAALGRSFVADDAQAGSDDVLVLGDATWRSRFAADPDVIGRELRLSDRTYTIIGVMPPGFGFPDSTTEAWRPYVMTAAERAQSEGNNVGDLDVVARLAPGVSVDQAQAALAAIFTHDASLAGLRANAGLEARARAWRDRYAASHWQALALFQLAALVLLLVVLANLVNLQLDRLLARAREFDIRRALGAGESAILRAVFADLAPPMIAGLLGGLALTPALMALLARRGLLPDDLPQGAAFGVATFAAGLAVVTVTLASGFAAAWASRRASRLSARAGIGGLGRLRPAMLVAQVVLTTALLGSAGLLLRSAVNVVSIERGFDARGVLLTLVDPVGVTVAGRTYDATTDAARFAPRVEELRREIASLPGVEHAAVSNAPPFSGWETVTTVGVPGRPETLQARGRGVGPGYFAALGIGLVAGRGFEASDAGAGGPVVVDELYAQRYLGGVDPLAAYVKLPTDTAGPSVPARIIGVAHTVKHESLDETATLPTVYRFDSAPLPVFWLVTRTSGDPAALAETVRRRIHALSPDIHVGINQPLADLVSATLTSRRALLEALGGFALGTLLLAGLGLAAVLSFAIRRRTGELGVRMALGATPARVRNLVLRQGGALIACGVVLGLGAGIGLARLLAGRLFGVSFADPASWIASASLVAAVALFACWLPARRAAATDPLVALRDE